MSLTPNTSTIHDINSFMFQNEDIPSSFNPNILYSHLQAEFQTSLNEPPQQTQFGLQCNPPQQIQELFQGFYLNYLSKNNIPVSSIVQNTNVNQEYVTVNVPITIPVKIPLQQESKPNYQLLSECILEPPQNYQCNQPMITYNQAPMPEIKPSLNYQEVYNANERINKLMSTSVPGISFNLLLAAVLSKNSI